MRCGKVRGKLMAYHDGELKGFSAARVARHLESCPDCARLLKAMERADEIAQTASGPAPDPAYWETFTGRIMEKVARETSSDGRQPAGPPPRFRLSPFRLAPALSMALVVVVAAGVLLKIRQPAVTEKTLAGQSTITEEARTLAREEFPAAGPGREASVNEAVPDPSSLRRKSADIPEEPGTLPPAPPPAGDPARTVKEAPASRTRTETRPETATLTLPPMESQESRPDGAQPSMPEDGSRDSFSALSAGETTALPKTGVEREPPMKGGPVDDGSWGQLAFARRLEEEGRHYESEEVLNDLLTREPATSVQEQALVLLIQVLENQDRIPEAREVLKNAQRQYPANSVIQNFRIED